MSLRVLAAGHLDKMVGTTAGVAVVQYQLPLDDQRVSLNQYIGQDIGLRFVGEIHCTHCGRKTNKSFSQGYCYPCFQKLAQCDSCIMSPEKCHFEQGTCREPEWAAAHCMTEHIVYIANSSGLKVGITRATQIPTRWIDQGATQALPVARVDNRRLSGILEVICKQHMADKTDWRAMLKGEATPVNLRSVRDNLHAEIHTDIRAMQDTHGLQAVQWLDEQEETQIRFPVEQYPQKVVAFNLDKEPVVAGKLTGIKGQYLILDTGVINIRKYTAYHVEFLVP